MTGSHRPWAPGVWDGRSGWTAWRSPSSPTFQQAGGIDLKPVSSEITYGCERIAMYLQGVDNVYDLEWVKGVKYGDIHHESEVEFSTHNFEEADVDMLLQLFGMYEKEVPAPGGKRAGPAGLRLRHEMFPYLQPAGPPAGPYRSPSAPPTSAGSAMWPASAPRVT